MTIISNSPEQTKKIAADIASDLTGGEVITLKGDLGSGKSTFTQGLAEALGVTQKVNSPTFLISKSYLVNDPRIKFIHHIDLYRLQESGDFKNLGIEEMFLEKDAITIIEWPERMGNLFPKKRIAIEFEYVDETKRKIIINHYE